MSNKIFPRLLYIGVHSHEGWGAEYWLGKAFERLGIHFITLDYRKIREEAGYAELRNKILALDDKFDAIFLQRADHIPASVFSGMVKPIVLWSTELLHRRRDVDQLLKTNLFSWVFVHTYRCEEIILKKFAHLKSCVSVLHNATPKENIIDVDAQDVSKRYFALFNRSLSLRRRWWVYPSRTLIHVKKGRYGDDYFNDLSQSHIAVNIHFSSNIDFETGIFEAMSVGCVVVSETLPDKIVSDLNMKDGIIQVSNRHELKEVLFELKSNSNLLNDYHQKSLHAIRVNTWDDRAKDILMVFNQVLS